MVDFLIALAVGTVLGFLSGLGTGGGSLLIVYLTGVLNTDPETARMVNLLFFIPSAVVASIFHFRQGQLKIAPMIPAVIGGCTAAALLSILSGKLDLAVLQKLFGALLIVTGLRELFYRPQKAK